MCSQRERQREVGDDCIPGNKCGLSTAGMKMLSGVAVAYGLENVTGSASSLNNVFYVCINVHSYSLSCVCGRERLVGSTPSIHFEV